VSAVSSTASGTASLSTRTGAPTTSTGPVATSTAVCPGSDGQRINTGAGAFVIECGIDRVGSDMADSPVNP
nr:hypothetical protein [Tanacetum cinerariifolium]